MFGRRMSNLPDLGRLEGVVRNWEVVAMVHEATPVETDSPISGPRSSALFSLVVGAAVSLGSMFWAGRHNSSIVLMLLFTFWVASPFAAMALMHRLARRWPIKRQLVFYNQIRIISFGSVLIYIGTDSFGHLAKPAGPFLALPAASWLLLAVWFFLTRSIHGDGSETTVLNLRGKQ
jgi:hypothetical protein